MTAITPQAPELWGGVECTLNRVGDRQFDQIQRSGHFDRPDDLRKFAQLGIKTLRYPVLWERTAPDGLELADWSGPDRQISQLRDLNITPIVGLLHHGSGPNYTSLTETNFHSEFAKYAVAVAQRYPWVNWFSLINEPLTTARFTGLYGHWHPHGRDEWIFARILLNQCRAIISASLEIRKINPLARFLVTEDVAPVFSTPLLAYQADFENERRWSSLDILCGKLVRGSRIRGHFSWLGIPDRDLDWFEENACPPDLIGLDYYPTSERYLDENFYLYPRSTWGGNGRHQYADVESVRVMPEGISGYLPLIREVWKRYDIPVAVTECHIACSVEEQIRWFYDCWDSSKLARLQGIPVKAVTAWSLLGAYDWDSLCTADRGHYEAGLFDISNGIPVATELAVAVAEISQGLYIPELSEGWWARPSRLLYPESLSSFSSRHFELSKTVRTN